MWFGYLPTAHYLWFYYIAPNPPQNISAKAVNSTTVEVTWDPPSITNGILHYYTIMYGSSDDMEMMEVNSSGVTMLVSRLDPFTNYTFFVLAVTIAPSEPSDTVTVLTDEAGIMSESNVWSFKILHPALIY